MIWHVRCDVHPTLIGPRDPGMKHAKDGQDGALDPLHGYGRARSMALPHGSGGERWREEDPAQVLDPGKVQWMSSYSVFEPWRSMLDTSVDGTSCVVLTWGFMRKSLYWTNQAVSNHLWIPLTLWFLTTDGSDACSNWLGSSH